MNFLLSIDTLVKKLIIIVYGFCWKQVMRCHLGGAEIMACLFISKRSPIPLIMIPLIMIPLCVIGEDYKLNFKDCNHNVYV